jgi:hypothetical protein
MEEAVVIGFSLAGSWEIRLGILVQGAFPKALVLRRSNVSSLRREVARSDWLIK